jgi:hypothetical protein
MYEPKSSLVVTIPLEFLYKYGTLLGKCHTGDSFPSKMQTPTQFYNTQ